MAQVVVGRKNQFFLPGEDIEREVLQTEVCKYLDHDATTRPGQYNGSTGFFIYAYRNFTTEQINDIKIISAELKRERLEIQNRKSQATAQVPSKKRARDAPAPASISAPPQVSYLDSKTYAENNSRYEEREKNRQRTESPPYPPPRHILPGGMPPNGLPTPTLQRAERAYPIVPPQAPPLHLQTGREAISMTPPYTTTPESTYSVPSNDGSRGHHDGPRGSGEARPYPPSESARQERPFQTPYPDVNTQYNASFSAPPQVNSGRNHPTPAQPPPPTQQTPRFDDYDMNLDDAMDMDEPHVDPRAIPRVIKAEPNYDGVNLRHDPAAMDIDMDPRRDRESRGDRLILDEGRLRDDRNMRNERDVRDDRIMRDGRDLRDDRFVRDERHPREDKHMRDDRDVRERDIRDRDYRGDLDYRGDTNHRDDMDARDSRATMGPPIRMPMHPPHISPPMETPRPATRAESRLEPTRPTPRPETRQEVRPDRRPDPRPEPPRAEPRLEPRVGPKDGRQPYQKDRPKPYDDRRARK